MCRKTVVDLRTELDEIESKIVAQDNRLKVIASFEFEVRDLTLCGSADNVACRFLLITNTLRSGLSRNIEAATVASPVPSAQKVAR